MRRHAATARRAEDFKIGLGHDHRRADGVAKPVAVSGLKAASMSPALKSV